jgi:hypothetical protein
MNTVYQHKLQHSVPHHAAHTIRKAEQQHTTPQFQTALKLQYFSKAAAKGCHSVLSAAHSFLCQAHVLTHTARTIMQGFSLVTLLSQHTRKHTYLTQLLFEQPTPYAASSAQLPPGFSTCAASSLRHWSVHNAVAAAAFVAGTEVLLACRGSSTEQREAHSIIGKL